MAKVSKPSRHSKSRITYANVMSTAAAVVAVASAATSKPVRKSIKRLRKKPMQFAFGLGSRPEDCVLVLKRKGQAKQLFQTSRQDSPLSCSSAARICSHRERSLQRPTSGVSRPRQSGFRDCLSAHCSVARPRT